jgi:hypothetical protein
MKSGLCLLIGHHSELIADLRTTRFTDVVSINHVCTRGYAGESRVYDPLPVFAVGGRVAQGTHVRNG